MTRGTTLALAAAVTSLAAGACVASKGDIRLLQEELRASRNTVARADTAAARRNDDLRVQLDQQARAYSAAIARLSDSLRILSTRFANFQAATSGELDLLQKQVAQMQALLGQTTRNLQDIRLRQEELRDQAPAPASAAAVSRRGGVPGPATLFRTALGQYQQRAYGTARRNFDLLVKTYPENEIVSSAQLYIGRTFDDEGNKAAADSVYQLVYTKYPATPEASNALYKRAIVLWDAGKKQDARALAQRIIREYPRSDEVDLANELLKRR
jgi:TolA-binding protein